MQHDFLLLDRSQSMSEGGLWTEALAAINGYVQKLADENVDTGVTLATFDLDQGQVKFEIIRERITPKTWRALTNKDATPRGGTPLNDAIGRIVNLANAGFNGVQYDRLFLGIMTDGNENASRELSGTAAKALLDECRAKGWQVIMLGANFENAKQAVFYGTAANQTMASSTVNLRNTLTMTASKRATYGLTGQAVNYSGAEKAQAAQGLGGVAQNVPIDTTTGNNAGNQSVP